LHSAFFSFVRQAVREDGVEWREVVYDATARCLSYSFC
jgi:hypothetical protein